MAITQKPKSMTKAKLKKLRADMLEYFSFIGHQGGIARKEKLTAARRRAIARKGAAARWPAKAIGKKTRAAAA